MKTQQCKRHTARKAAVRKSYTDKHSEIHEAITTVFNEHEKETFVLDSPTHST